MVAFRIAVTVKGALAVVGPALAELDLHLDFMDNAAFEALSMGAKAGLDPVLMAASNSSGGVLGKMVSPQNLAIAAAAVGMSGNEGEIFRKVFAWSLVLLRFMCVRVTLQATPVLGWMVP